MGQAAAAFLLFLVPGFLPRRAGLAAGASAPVSAAAGDCCCCCCGPALAAAGLPLAQLGGTAAAANAGVVKRSNTCGDAAGMGV